MNKKTKHLLLICVSLTLNSQLSTLNCNSQELQRERTFTASGLYGYMNGGADLYLEYGVEKLTVREVAYNGEAYNVEIYEMPSPEDAFGIYSLHTFRCQRADTLGCINCLSLYQLQTATGNYYVSVVFPSGSQRAKEGADELLRKYVPMEEAEKPDFPALMEIDPPYSGNLKYMRGPISTSNVSYPFSKLVEDIPYSGIWFIMEKPSKEYRALICLPDNKEIDKIKERISPGQILQTGDGYLYITGKEEEVENPNIFGF